MTIAYDPWKEIARVARSYECESLLVGFSSLEGRATSEHIEHLLNDVECDVVALRAPKDWALTSSTRIIVPVGGRGGHDELRARLLGSLGRAGCTNVRFVQVTAESLPARPQATARARAPHLCRRGNLRRPRRRPHPIGSDIVQTVANEAGPNDLIILGLRHHRGKRLFSELALQVARKTSAATLMISRRT